MPGRSERHQEAMNSSGRGDGGGARPRRAVDGGQGSASTPLPVCSQGTAVTNPACKGLRATQPAVQRGYEPRALALPLPELVRAAAPSKAGQIGHSSRRAAGPVRRWGWDRDGDAGTGPASHPVYKHWWEEPHSQGHVGSSHSRTKPSCQQAPESPVPPPTGNCLENPAPLAGTSPNWGGTQDLGEPLTLQAHTLPPRSGP